MTTQADPNKEQVIRAGLRVARLFVAYAPFALSRWLQTVALYHVRLPAAVTTQRISQPLGEWFSAINVDDESPVVLYLHGGGFVFPQTPLHRTMLAQLTQDIHGRMLMIDYRLAPENPFPAALDDCTAAYQYLLNEGIAPQRITLMGDSAGGNLALALLVLLRDQGMPLPALGITISAPTDLTHDNPSHGMPDDILHPRTVDRFTRAYVGEQDATNPLISPVFADLRGLPRLLMYVGALEALANDSRRLAAVADAAGVDVTLHVYPRMWHVWQLSLDLPQARQSLAEISAVIRQTCDASEILQFT